MSISIGRIHKENHFGHCREIRCHQTHLIEKRQRIFSFRESSDTFFIEKRQRISLSSDTRGRYRRRRISRTATDAGTRCKSRRLAEGGRSDRARSAGIVHTYTSNSCTWSIGTCQKQPLCRVARPNQAAKVPHAVVRTSSPLTPCPQEVGGGGPPL